MASVDELNVKINFNLVKALKYAVDIIEAYEGEIRNWKLTGGMYLDKTGFCQGSIFKGARKRIIKFATGGKDA